MTTAQPAQALQPALQMQAHTTSPQNIAQNGNINDPLEPLNRAIFHFNDFVDFLIIRPLAQIYRDATPTFIQNRVSNGLSNLYTPVIFLNDVLQLNFEHAFESLGRFIINSTVGLLGLFDVANEVGLPYHHEDFGQTLGRWGVDDGPYLVLPFFGASNPRDFVGLVVDWLTDPFNQYVRHRNYVSLGYIRTGANIVDLRAQAISFTDKVAQMNDPYAQYRMLYTQNRKFKILNDKPNVENSPKPYDDDDE